MNGVESVSAISGLLPARKHGRLWRRRLTAQQFLANLDVVDAIHALNRRGVNDAIN